MKKTLEKKFNPLIGCPTYINLKNGYLIIDSKAKVIQMSDSTGVGMFVGLNPIGPKGYELMVSYNRGFVSAVYQSKFCKII